MQRTTAALSLRVKGKGVLQLLLTLFLRSRLASRHRLPDCRYADLTCRADRRAATSCTPDVDICRCPALCRQSTDETPQYNIDIL